MNAETPTGLDRRGFLRRAGRVGGAAAIGLGMPSLLAACGSSGSKTATDRLTLSTDLGGNQLIGLFNYTGNYLVTGIPQRMPFTIATPEGPPARTGPDTLTVLLHDGDHVSDPIVLVRHSDGTPIGYYPLTTTFPTTGTWTLSTDLDGNAVEQSFLVQPPTSVPLLQTGQRMATVDTPTVADARGVKPICTRSPQCPLHDQTLTEALSRNAPVALLIATPQFCQTGVCGPVLDLLLEQRDQFPTVQFVHAEVYMDPNGGGDPASRGLTPAVSAYGLSFEPSLFVANPNGTIATRLDNIFDRGELHQALQSVTA
jgi:hypothetical protein